MRTKKIPGTGSLPLHGGRISVSLSNRSDASTARIESYDIVRAFAVLGMIVVNYNVILLEFTSKYSHTFFTQLGDILTGRAAALFVMLAGIGITLMARSALISGDADKLAVVRRKILMRCIALFLMGHLFWLFWRADILHFYALFLAIGVLLLPLAGKTIWLINILLAAVSTIIFCLTGGDPDISSVFNFKGVFLENLSDMLFSGYYAAFPWLSFLLAGIWLGKSQMAGSSISLGKIAIGSLVVFLFSEKLLGIGDMYYADATESLTALLLTREAFPMSPLSLLSAGSGAIFVIIVTMMSCRNRLALNLLMPLKNVGRLSLTIYVSHVFMAFAFAAVFKPKMTVNDYVSAVIVFFLLSILFYLIFANLWCKYFKYGPLEWILRVVSNFGGGVSADLKKNKVSLFLR